MSSLLINDRPLVLLPSLAKVVGVEEAIILQQIHYLCSSPTSGKILSDGQKYVWNTFETWQKEYFSFWSVSTLKRKIRALEEQGLLISQKPNSHDRDHTKYYRVDEEKLAELAIKPVNSDKVKLTQSNGSNWSNGTVQSDPIFKGTETSNKEQSDVETTSDGFIAVSVSESWCSIQARKGILPTTSIKQLGRLGSEFGVDKVNATFCTIEEKLKLANDAVAYFKAALKNADNQKSAPRRPEYVGGKPVLQSDDERNPFSNKFVF